MRSFAFFGLLILGLIGIKLSQARRETIREAGFEALGEVQSILSQLEEVGEESVDWKSLIGEPESGSLDPDKMNGER
jgi:hypothetical protein